MSAKGRERPFEAKNEGPSPIEFLRDEQMGEGLRHFFRVTHEMKPNRAQMTKIRM